MRAITRALALAAMATPLIVPARAVPAWSRKTGLECASCHMGATNRLTKMGRDYLVRGHRFASEEGVTKENRGNLNFLNYASLSSKVRYTARKTTGTAAKPDTDPSTGFDVESLSLYTGGPASGKFSFFIEYYLHERGQAAADNGTAIATATRTKLADAYLQYNTNPAAPKYGWVRAGQIYPYLIYMASSGGRVSINRPLVINNNVGGGNLYTPRDRAYGVSGGYTAEDMGVRLEGGIINGSGGNARPNLDERNNSKDVFLTAEKELDPHGSTIGLYGYTGKFPHLNADKTIDFDEKFSRYGVIGYFQRETFELSGAYLTGKNDIKGGGSRNPKGWYAEGAYSFTPDLAGYARYDYLNDDFADTTTTDNKRRGPTVGASYRLGDNGRLVGEWTTLKATGRKSTNQFQTEINWLF